MNQYFTFAIGSASAFIGGIALYTGAHAYVAGTPTYWLEWIVAGLVPMGTYWGGVVSRNPFGGGGPKP